MKNFQHNEQNNPYVRETVKVAEIKDNFGRTRYKVAMTDFHGSMPNYYDDLREFDVIFQITVVSYCYGDEALTIVEKYEQTYENAIRTFNKYVELYSDISKVETKDYQDIRIWADKTGYHKIKPDCCARCKYSRPINKDNSLFNDWYKNHINKFICTNSDLYKIPGREEAGFSDIRPEVDCDGICNGFERIS